MPESARCWASVRGDCDNEITKEHWISKSQFGDASTIRVQGFSWCKDEPKTVGIQSIVSRNLCRKHNNGTSDLDAEAGKLLGALREIGPRLELIQEQRKALPRKTYKLSGDRIERWLLKTTINLALRGESQPRAGLFGKDGRPVPRYVETVFGRPALFDCEGMAWVATVGEDIPDSFGTIEFRSWISDGALVASFLRFHGHRLWLALEGAPEIADAMRPVPEIIDARTNMRIMFKWGSRRRRQHARLRHHRAE